MLLLLANITYASSLCDNAKSECIEIHDTGHAISPWETTSWAFYCPQSNPYIYQVENESDSWVSAILASRHGEQLNFLFTNWGFSDAQFGAKWSCTIEENHGYHPIF